MADSSFSSSSDDDDEEQQHQATAQVKGRTPPLNKKPTAGEQQPAASPYSLRKKPAASEKRQKVTSAAPAPVPSPAAADDDSGSIKVASDSSPKPVHSSTPNELPSAAASQQMRLEKKRKQMQQQDGASVQEGEVSAMAASGLSSKKPFQRVWAEEDEVTLLQTMLCHPTVPDISVAVGGKFFRKQTFEKLRKLKKKYKKHLCWAEKGEGLSFTNSHDQRVFELSKKVWPTVEGDAHGYKGGDEKVRTNGKGEKMGCHELEQKYPMLREGLSLLEEDGDNLLAGSTSGALEALEPAKLMALECQWRKHFKTGVTYCLERARMKEDLLELIVKLL